MRFFLDVHVNLPAARELVRRGLDVEHAVDSSILRTADDPLLLEHAMQGGRIMVTRNYHDFAPLVEALNRLGRPFPGVLFIAKSIRENDPGAHVRAIEEWVAASPPGENPAENTYGWLR